MELYRLVTAVDFYLCAPCHGYGGMGMGLSR